MTEAALVSRLRTAEPSMLDLLERLVMTETPSADVARVHDGLRALCADVQELLGEAPQVIEVDGRQHLRLRGGGERPVLVLCHLDTVWPIGTTAWWPFQVVDGTATGPGVFDMKAGLVQALHAVRALDRQDDVTLLVTTDEELGSPTSRLLVEEEARRSRAVLVFEPSADGAVKTARKGTSTYHLNVRGRAAHAGLDPERGVNAIVELSHQVRALIQLRNPQLGTTVTPTTAHAGTTTNTVPAAAVLAVDVRATTTAEQERVDTAFRCLRPVQQGATMSLSGGINRPPLARGASATMYSLATRCAALLGLAPLAEASVGGGSDGNFTAALGVPTLDGLGAVGDGAHAEGECVMVSAMAERSALAAEIIGQLSGH